MTGKKFISVSENCFKHGRTFSHEASRLCSLGIIAPDDPRVKYSTKVSRLKVPKGSRDIANLVQNIDCDGITPAALGPMLVSKKIIKSLDDNPDLDSRLSYCLEAAAMKTNDDGGNPEQFVAAAATITDAAILKNRHQSYDGSVAALAETTKIPPQRILAGLIRTNDIEPSDFRVIAFTDGLLDEANQLDRTSFYQRLGQTMKADMSDLKLSDGTSPPLNLERLWSLSDSSTHKSISGEIQTLHASATIAERVSRHFAKTDPERAKQLSGLSMSASSRAIFISESSLTTERDNVRAID